MKVWVTRPYAYECYMGGWRDCYIHLVKPFYDHRIQYDGSYGYEYGWYYGNHKGQRVAKDFFKQDKFMEDKVWGIINWTLSMDDDIMHESWYNDKLWETKCNRNYKRTLIEVDLYKRDAYLIVPEVNYGDCNRVETIEIPDNIAIQSTYYQDDTHSDIPF